MSFIAIKFFKMLTISRLKRLGDFEKSVFIRKIKNRYFSLPLSILVP